MLAIQILQRAAVSGVDRLLELVAGQRGDKILQLLVPPQLDISVRKRFLRQRFFQAFLHTTLRIHRHARCQHRRDPLLEYERRKLRRNAFFQCVNALKRGAVRFHILVIKYGRILFQFLSLPPFFLHPRVRCERRAKLPVDPAEMAFQNRLLVQRVVGDLLRDEIAKRAAARLVREDLARLFQRFQAVPDADHLALRSRLGAFSELPQALLQLYQLFLLRAVIVCDLRAEPFQSLCDRRFQLFDAVA